MLQRKWNLHVKDSRSSEERDQEDLDIITAASMSEFPQPQRIYLSIQLRELGKVCLKWHRHLELVRESNSVEEKHLLGQGNILCGEFQGE